MKILHVITSLHTGGAEKLMVDLLPRIKYKGYSLPVTGYSLRDDGYSLPVTNSTTVNTVELCVFDGEKTPFYEQLSEKGIEIHGLTRSAYSLMNVVKLIPLIRKYDVIHTHNTACQFAVALLSYFTNAKLVTTEHNTTNRRRGNRLWYLLDKWMYSRYDKVICISDKAKENLIEYLGDDISKEKVITIYNGIDLSRFSQTQHGDSLPDVNVVTMVAAFRKQKDQATLIRAIGELPENYLLQLVGGGDYFEDTKRWVETLSYSNRVKFLGVRNDVPQLLMSSDVVVMSSHYEGLSLSNLEGMACGRPFVASDVDGLHEIVDGYGILFEHENYKQLALIIKRLCEDKEYAQSVAEKCQQRATQFDISVMAEKYMGVYFSLMR